MIFTEIDKNVTMQFNFNKMKKRRKTLFNYLSHKNDHQ